MLNSEVYIDGNKIASISSLLKMSLAIARVSAESIPPDNPNRIPLRLLFFI